MTIERAIEILDPNHREHYDNIDIVNEACCMGMVALMRLQPQEIVEDYPLYRCPKCGSALQVLQKYCDECGQAVKWNE